MKKLIAVLFLLLLAQSALSQSGYSVSLRAEDYRWLDSNNEWILGNLFADLKHDGAPIEPSSEFTYHFYNDASLPGNFQLWQTRPGPYNFVQPDGMWDKRFGIFVIVTGPGFSVQSTIIYVQKPGGPPALAAFRAELEDGTALVSPYEPGGDELLRYENYLGPHWYSRYLSAPWEAQLSTARDEYLAILPDYLVNSGQKFHHWNGEVSDVLNHTRFTFELYAVPLVGHFKSNHNGITIRNQLVENPTMDFDYVRFKDPWLKDFVDVERASYIRNQGLSAPFKSVASPFNPNSNPSGPGSEYKGVFLNQEVATGVYYSIRAPIVQTINGSAAFFQGWSYDPNKASVQSLGGDSAAVVFKVANATVTANYKAHLGSSLSSVTGLTSQRKMIKGAGGYHAVYESVGEIWYTKSTDNGQTWSPEIRLSRGSGTAHNPSVSEVLDYSGYTSTYAYFVWVEVTNRPGASGYDINVKKLNMSTGSWSATEPIIDAFYPSGPGYAAQNAHPVAVSYRDEETYPHVIVAYESAGTGIRYSYLARNEYYEYMTVWTTNTVPNTTSSHVNPSITTLWPYLYLTFNTGSNVYLVSSYQIVPDDYTPYVAFYSPETVPCSEPLYQIVNSNIDADMGGWRHVTWVANEGIAFHRSKNAGGGWSALYMYYDDFGGEGWIGSSVSGYDLGSGGALVYGNGVVLVNTVTTDGVNWSPNTYLQLSNSGFPNLVPKNARITGSLIRQNASAPYTVKYQVWDNSNRLAKTSGFAAGFMKPTERTYHRISFLDPKDSASLIVQIGNLSIEDNTTAKPLSFEKLDPNNLETSKVRFLRSSSFTLSASQMLSGEISITSTSGKFEGSASVNLMNKETGEFITNMGRFDCSKPTSINSRLSQGITTNTAGMEVFLEVVLDGMDMSNIDVDHVIAMHIGQSAELAKGQGGSEEPARTIPADFGLSQNYPNPFNPTTQIVYRLKEDGRVKLVVYDVLGRVIENLVDGDRSAGYYTAIFDASGLGSGIYFYQLTVVPEKGQPFSQTGKMLFQK